MNNKGNDGSVRIDCMTLGNQFGDSLQIYYEGDNLYFESTKSNPNSVFYVGNRNEIIYPGLKCLFSYLHKHDKMQLMPVGKLGCVFEWVGEGKGLPEVQDRLTIEECNNLFRIRLDKSKFNKKESVKVGFSLTDSKYPEIVKIIDDAFISLLKYPYIFKRRTKVKENSRLK